MRMKKIVFFPAGAVAEVSSVMGSASSPFKVGLSGFFMTAKRKMPKLWAEAGMTPAFPLKSEKLTVRSFSSRFGNTASWKGSISLAAAVSFTASAFFSPAGTEPASIRR